MEPRTFAIAEFRQRVSEIIHEIEETKVPVVLTRHGVAVVEIRPVKSLETSLRGTVFFSDAYDPAAPAVPEDDWESA